MELTNQSPAVCNLEIWTVMSKVTKVTYTNPEDDWNTGDADSSSTATNSWVGSKPTESKFFNMNWKVKSVKKLQLAGGSTHTHVVDFNCRRYIDTEYWNKFQQIRGLTVAVFCIAWGQVGDTSNNPTVGSITTVPVKIIGQQNRMYFYDMINAFPRQIYHGITALAQDPLPNIYVEQEGSSTVADVQDSVLPNIEYA